MGSHVGGYDRWTVDISEVGNGRHPIAVRCDNSRDVEMIPSDMSDFCLYGGLYRPVHLVYLPERYISDVRIDVEGDRVSVKTLPSDIGDVSCSIVSPDGKTVYEGGIGQPIRIRKPRSAHPHQETCVVGCGFAIALYASHHLWPTGHRASLRLPQL